MREVSWVQDKSAFPVQKNMKVCGPFETGFCILRVQHRKKNGHWGSKNRGARISD